MSILPEGKNKGDSDLSSLAIVEYMKHIKNKDFHREKKIEDTDKDSNSKESKKAKGDQENEQIESQEKT